MYSYWQFNCNKCVTLIHDVSNGGNRVCEEGYTRGSSLGFHINISVNLKWVLKKKVYKNEKSGPYPKPIESEQLSITILVCF